jgi:hypothetical protein
MIAGMALLAGVLAAGAPTARADFRCRSVRSIRLVPVDPTARVLSRGHAEIDQCVGLTFLRVTVRGRVPDQTSFVAGIPGIEPILGDVFAVVRGRGETTIEGIGLETVTGREIAVYDESFTQVLTGRF